jgi:hypothetical protein
LWPAGGKKGGGGDWPKKWGTDGGQLGGCATESSGWMMRTPGEAAGDGAWLAGEAAKLAGEGWE